MCSGSCLCSYQWVCVCECMFALFVFVSIPFDSIQCNGIRIESNRIYVSDVKTCASLSVLCVFIVTNFPIWMWPIVSGKSSFLIWGTKSHKFRCQRGSKRERERHGLWAIAAESQQPNAPTQPWRQKQICYIVFDTKEVFELKWKWKQHNLFAVRMRYTGFVFDAGDELDDDFSWFVRSLVRSSVRLDIDVLHVHIVFIWWRCDLTMFRFCSIFRSVRFWKLGFRRKNKNHTESFTLLATCTSLRQEISSKCIKFSSHAFWFRLLIRVNAHGRAWVCVCVSASEL